MFHYSLGTCVCVCVRAYVCVCVCCQWFLLTMCHIGLFNCLSVLCEKNVFSNKCWAFRQNPLTAVADCTRSLASTLSADAFTVCGWAEHQVRPSNTVISNTDKKQESQLNLWQRTASPNHNIATTVLRSWFEVGLFFFWKATCGLHQTCHVIFMFRD